MILTRVEYNVIMAINDHDNFIYRISNNINSTYAHVVKVIDRLEALEIIESKHVGRKRIIKLTEKGLEVRELLLKIRSVIGMGDVS